MRLDRSTRRTFIQRATVAGTGLLCPAWAAAGRQSPIAEHAIPFEFLLLQQIGASKQHGENVVVSPASLAAALCLLQLGADPVFSTALARLLMLESPSASSFSRLRQSLTPLLATGTPRSPLTGLALAYVGEKSTLTPSIQEAFVSAHVTLREVDLSQPEVIQSINQTVRERTQNRISSILEAPLSNDGLVLLNAFAFQGKWATPFDDTLTSTADFTNLSRKVQARLMQSETLSVPAATDGPFTVIELPYKQTRYCLRLIIRNGPPAALNDFASAAHWLRGSDLASRPVNVTMPRFSLRAGQQLLPVLDAMGLAKPRSAPGAIRKFTGQDLALQEVRQKVVIEIDEGGTVAAAATAVNAGPTMAPSPPGLLTFRADRPFLFALRDRNLDLCLMTGYVADPTA